MTAENPPVSEPTRAQVRNLLKDLVDGSVSRDQAHEWALPLWTVGQVHDEMVWGGICMLCDADSHTPDGYLYGSADFQDWLEEFDALAAGN
jgi:hypothetical protein